MDDNNNEAELSPHPVENPPASLEQQQLPAEAAPTDRRQILQSLFLRAAQARGAETVARDALSAVLSEYEAAVGESTGNAADIIQAMSKPIEANGRSRSGERGIHVGAGHGGRVSD